MTVAIVDSGFLYAVLDIDDRYHDAALSILNDNRWQFYVPHVILVEVFHDSLARQRSPHRSRQLIVHHFAQGLTIVTEELGLHFEEITPTDYRLIAQLLRKYADAGIDYVNAVVVALAERFGTRYIMTVDARDFRTYVPSFAPHFVLPLFDDV